VSATGVEGHRVVQITASAAGRRPVKGSGYLAGAGLVITAAHTVAHADTVAVLRVLRRGETATVDAAVVWIDPNPGTDLAVLRLATAPENASAFPADLPPLRFGRIVAPVDCEAVGFPLFKLAPDARDRLPGRQPAFRDSHHAIGTTSPLANLRDGSLEVTVRPPGADPDEKRSPWEGMSGAALFAGGALIGLVCQHRRGEGLRRLTANRVEHWYDLESEALAALRELLRLPERDRLEVLSTGVDGLTALHQLPSRVAGFTGRFSELAKVVGHLAPGSGTDTVAVSAVAGLAGVGKTALAVHAAHTAVDAGWFPGGVLYLDLHGYDETPVQATQALDALLRALGVPGEMIPKEVQAQAGLYRSRLAERDAAVLVVADNASSSEQVLPLVPGDARHRVLVTSRHTLPRLAARRFELLILSPQSAIEVVEAALRTADEGDDRISADRAGAELVAQYCGYLPLALQIASALLSADPGLSPTELAEQLADTATLLAHLDDGERAVRAAFDLSYRRLTVEQVELFRLLGFNPGLDLSTTAAAALADKSEPYVRRILDDLVRAHLVERTATRDRWRMHDLIRAYTRELAARLLEPERLAPARRLLEYYLHATRAADQLLVFGRRDTEPSTGKPRPNPAATTAVPQFVGRDEAVAWLEAERQNLEPCVCFAAAIGESAHATGIAHAAATFFRQMGYWQQANSLHRTAARVAEGAHDRLAQADALQDLGQAQRLLGESAAATASLQQALTIYCDLGDRLGQADTLIQLCVLQRMIERYAAAMTSEQLALTIYRDLGDRHGQANALNNLGATQRLTGEYALAAETLEEALTLFRDLGDRHGQANALNNLGATQRHLEDYAVAAETLEEALILFRGLGNRLGQANTLYVLGGMQETIGQYVAAAESLEEALALFRGLGHGLGQANALYVLGAIQWQTGEYAAAAESLGTALTLFHDDGQRLGQANVLSELGAVQRLTGDYAAAAESLEEALAIYRGLGDRAGQAGVLNRRAELVGATGGTPEQVRALHFEALRIAREVGSRWDEANALAGIGATYQSEGDRPAARAHFQQALAHFRATAYAADAARVETTLAGLENTEACTS
jgi:tetratricopeptide (TPR) repeat protein